MTGRPFRSSPTRPSRCRSCRASACACRRRSSASSRRATGARREEPSVPCPILGRRLRSTSCARSCSGSGPKWPGRTPMCCAWMDASRLNLVGGLAREADQERGRGRSRVASSWRCSRRWRISSGSPRRPPTPSAPGSSAEHAARSRGTEGPGAAGVGSSGLVRAAHVRRGVRDPVSARTRGARGLAARVVGGAPVRDGERPV